MNDERWFELKEKLKEKFSDIKESAENTSHEDDVGNKIPEKKESLEFKSPLGELRIERVTHPKIIDKKAHYHKGSGGAKVEYVLSNEEVTHKMTIYKKDDFGEWRPLEIPTENFGF